jgi:ADP-heptose:LPS heptosyltransferase
METILVYRTGQLGDTVCAIPAIQAIRENFKPCRIVLLADIHPGTTYPKVHEVLSEFGLIDDYIIYDPRKIWSVPETIQLRSQITQRKIRKAICLPQRERRLTQKVRDYLFFKLCRIKKIYGLKITADLNQVQEVKQEAQRLLDLLYSEGIQTDGKVVFQLPVVNRVKLRVDDLWDELGLVGKNVIVLSPGSKMPVKRWDMDNYRAVGQKLIERYGVDLLIIGGNEDAVSADGLCKALGPQCVNLGGQTSYAESAEILRRCMMYLGNDSGAMHLAAAVGTPCVAIFSARDEVGAWYPFGENHIVLRKEVECQGCMLAECVEKKMKCMKDISVEEVFTACEKVMISRGIEKREKTLA